MKIDRNQCNKVSFKSFHYENTALNDADEKYTKTAIWGINDLHGTLSSMAKLKTASDVFDKKFKNQDRLKVSSGDIGISSNPDKQKFCLSFLDKLGIMAATLGNHEFDVGFKTLSKLLKESPINFVAVNYELKNESTNFHEFGEISQKYNNNENTRIFDSFIVNENGHKYGFIGVLPEEMDSICAKFDSSGILIHNYIKTKYDIEEQIKKLEKQGVNKIILLSHMGSDTDRKLAQEINGIDIIQSAHSHDLVEEILFSPNGSPVAIIQAGENGENFSQLEIIFNSKGIIKSVQGGIKKIANMEETDESRKIENEINSKFGTTTPITEVLDKINSKKLYDKVVNIVYSIAWNKYLNEDDESNPLEYLFNYINSFPEKETPNENNTINLVKNKPTDISDKAFLAGMNYLLTKEELIKIQKEITAQNNLTETIEKKSAYAKYVANALKQQTDSDIAFVNISAIRNTPLTNLNERNIRTELLPLDDYPIKVELSEKEIINAIKISANQGNIPEMLQSSGLSFSFDNKLTLIQASITNSKGEEIKLNIKYPSDSKKFSAVYGSGFLYLGGLNYLSLKEKHIIKKYDKTFADYVISYINETKKTVTLEPQEELFWQLNYLNQNIPIKRGKEIQEEASKNNWVKVGNHTYEFINDKLQSI